LLMQPRQKQRQRSKNKKKRTQATVKKEKMMVQKVHLMRNPWLVTKKTNFRINKVLPKSVTSK